METLNRDGAASNHIGVFFFFNIINLIHYNFGAKLNIYSKIEEEN
jgi:hypothetical protein